jgi:outer membrane protein assembly factor BamB
MQLRGLWALGVVATWTAGAAADWPRFLGPHLDNTDPNASLAATWPEGGPEVLWGAPLGPGYCGPSVRGGEVYVLDRDGTAGDVLRCFDLADGNQTWTFAYDAPGKLGHHGSRAAPTVGERYVFTVGPFGHLHCVDRRTHRPVWRRHLVADFDGRRPHWGVSQAPLLRGEAVIVAPLGKTVGVAALNKATGKVLWQSPAFGRMAYSSPTLATIDGVEQVLMMSQSTVAGVQPGTGKLLWTYSGYRCRIPIPCPLHAGGGRIFITGGYNAGSVMIRVGRQAGRWTVRELFRLKDHGAQIHQPLLHEGHLYATCNTNSKSDGLVCISLDGVVRWQTGRQPNFERGGSLLAGGVILIMDGRRGVLRMVQPDPARYRQLAEAKVLDHRPIWAPMALVGTKLLCRDQRRLKCLELGGGGQANGRKSAPGAGPRRPHDRARPGGRAPSGAAEPH